MNLALVHDWVVTLGGAETCVAAFHEIWPEAPLFTLVYDRNSVGKLGFDEDRVRASFIQRLPGAPRRYQSYLPLFPVAIEQFDLSGYDVIFSSSHCAAKGVLARADQLHICYCHTPARYAWDMMQEYLRENRLERGLKSFLARVILHRFRIWDVQTANRVDFFLANSAFTARRIWRTYRREARVIYPPVNTGRFVLNENKKDYFIYVSRLVPYKRADLVVQAFTRLGLPLKVVGDGPQFDLCRRLAGKNVEMLGAVENHDLAPIVAGARALVFAAEEDFGIVPVEAQACGTPVIALGRGGVTESVVPADGNNWDRATGVFFLEQSVDAIEGAVRKFLEWEGRFDPRVVRANAERFGRERFKQEIAAFVSEIYEYWREKK